LASRFYNSLYYRTSRDSSLFTISGSKNSKINRQTETNFVTHTRDKQII